MAIVFGVGNGQMESSKDYYKILGISKTASKEEIKAAYRRLAKEYHPDRNKGKDSVAKFIEINEAYSFLIQTHHEPLQEEETKGCYYHISPHKGKLNECRFCGKSFCKQHIIPHPPSSLWGAIKFGIPEEKHPCPDCPDCPYCESNTNHPVPYEDPYFNQDKKTFDFPYLHRTKCFKRVTIDTRHEWQHDCIPLDKIIKIIEAEFSIDSKKIENLSSTEPLLSNEVIGKRIIEYIFEISSNKNSIDKIRDSFEKLLKDPKYPTAEKVLTKRVISKFDEKRTELEKTTLTEKPKPPKPTNIEDPKFFVRQVFDIAFDVQLNENIYNNIRISLRSLRKEILNKEAINEYEIQQILNSLIIILKNNSFEKKLESACSKFVKNIYEKCGIDEFSYWKELLDNSKKIEPRIDGLQLCPICKTYSVIPIPDSSIYWCTNCKKNIKKPEGKIPKYIKKQLHKEEKRFTVTYTYRTIHEAELIYKTAKISNTNIIEDIEPSWKIINIELNEKSITFIYKINKSKLFLAITTAVLVITLILLIWFVLNRNDQYIKIEEVKNISSNITKIIYESVPINFSFSEYINNKEKYDGKIITLTGFMRYRLEGTENAGVYNEYIVDDFNNEIKLQNIPQQYRKLFIVKGTSKELYNVTGTFKRKFKNVELEVSTIIVTERPARVIAREIQVHN